MGEDGAVLLSFCRVDEDDDVGQRRLLPVLSRFSERLFTEMDFTTLLGLPLLGCVLLLLLLLLLIDEEDKDVKDEDLEEEETDTCPGASSCCI